MSTVIALHWNETTLHYVVVQDEQVEIAASVPLESDMAPAAIGQRIAGVLAPYAPGRAKVVVALGRGALDWQHLSLPPCPADELPDVVRLQADRDSSPTDEELGFDFLPLLGDAQTPQEVLTFALAATELDKIRQICRSANLTLERIVPLAAGWPAITQQISSGIKIKLGTVIFVALQNAEATLWATRAGRVILFRQFQLAAGNDSAALATAVGSELRRTLLALSQHAENNKPTIFLVGNRQNQHEALVQTLHQQLEVPVQSLDVATQHPLLTHETSSAPLAGFAIYEAQNNSPLVDLLHPRQRSKAQINVRTYALAAAAATLVITLLGWTSYARLNAPLNQAATDQAELTLLEASLDDLKKIEQRAATIRDWNAATPNLLIHLQQVSKSIRPQALGDEGFSVEHDVVLEKLELDKRQLTLDAMTRNSLAVQPLEKRLRASAYRPQRIKSNPSKTIPDYPWHLKSTLEITTASDHFDPTTDDSAADSSAQEPPS